MVKKVWKRRIVAGAVSALVLASQWTPNVLAEEYYEPYVEYYPQEFNPDGFYEEYYQEEYYDDGYYDEQFVEDEYYEEEFYDDGEHHEREHDEEEEEETETETERGKSDPEYGADEYRQRRKPEDTYIYRKNPKESKFEDFTILKKEDADKYFHIVSYDKLPKKVDLEVAEVLQRPELPTGCESVALTMALRYEGFDLLKTEIAAEFLIYNLKDENAAIGFIGDPFDGSGAGCFAPALAATADNFFIDQGYNYRAFDISGSEFEELLGYVASGTPVMVWTTMFMEPVEFTGEYGVLDGKEYKWYKSEHCVVISGYDLDKGVITVNDPMEGIVERNIDEFKAIYNEIGQYAVVVSNLDDIAFAAEEDKNASQSLGIMIETEIETEKK